jgi:DHA2 family multidrug resistance protein-like MFS transporter
MGIAAGTWLAPVLATRMPAHILVPAGLGLSACAEMLLLLVAPGHALLPLVAAYTLVSFGCGPLFAFGVNRVVSAAPAEAAGRAAALAETGNHLGSAAGLAALGTIGRMVAGLCDLGRVTPCQQGLRRARRCGSASPGHQP